MRRDLIHKVLGNRIVLTQTPRGVRRTGRGGEAHGAAEVVGSGFAEGAGAAGDAGFEGHAVAGGEGGYEGADGVDCAGGFVAHYDAGEGVDLFADTAVVPEVDLGLGQ